MSILKTLPDWLNAVAANKPILITVQIFQIIITTFITFILYAPIYHCQFVFESQKQTIEVYVK